MSLIVSSVLSVNELQGNGQRIIHELHTDVQGVVREIRYVAGAGVDVATVMATHAAQFDISLVDDEIAGLLA